MDEEATNDRALLAAILQHGPFEEAAVRLSGKLLERFNGLGPLLATLPDGVAQVSGMTPTRVAALRAVPKLARRYFAASLPATE